MSNSISADKSFSLKDRLFNSATVDLLSAGLQRAYPRFDGQGFSQSVLAQFPELELKACIDCMADALVERLPADYAAATRILLKALPPPLDPTLQDDDFGEFIWAVPSEYAARHGLAADRLDCSLALLHQTTQRFSAEFAIRPFLRDFPEETLSFLERCAQDSHYHVRRLASEGVRPRLPWGLRVDLPLPRVLGLLDTLHSDPTRFVTRSVANNLNDLSKSEPLAVLERLDRWRRASTQQPDELDWLTRHALRGLVKTDHPQALEMLGYPVKPRFRLAQVSSDDEVQVGGSLKWSCTLTSTANQRLKILLRVHYLKANGSHSARVFALKDTELAAGEALQLSKTLAFKAMTTRALYPGEHFIEVVVNGVARGKRRFMLLALSGT